MHSVFGDVTKFITVVATANADIAIHLRHLVCVKFCPKLKHLVRCTGENFTLDAIVVNVDVRFATVFVDFFYKKCHQLPVATASVNPHSVALAYSTRVVDKVFCKFLLSEVV